MARDHKTPGVARITIAGTTETETETEIAGPFKKLVGLVATPTALFVSDQTEKAIVKIAVPGYAVSQLATVPAVDLLMMLPNGDLLTGGGPAISRITQTGTVARSRGGHAPPPLFARPHRLRLDPIASGTFSSTTFAAARSARTRHAELPQRPRGHDDQPDQYPRRRRSRDHDK